MYALNHLLSQLASTVLNKVWVGGITCLPKQGVSWLYLFKWLDRCPRKIVSWDVRGTMPEVLVSEALRRALATRRLATRRVLILTRVASPLLPTSGRC